MSGVPDPASHRAQSAEFWEGAAAGWARHGAHMRRFAGPVSQRMIEALALQPGERVLEVAAGMAETGLLAAEMVAPGGSLLVTDQSEAMLAGARARAVELQVSNVEFRQMDAEWLDLPIASFDAALCRFGYMLVVDPAAALAETRRVLIPGGGRLALAVWDVPKANPWVSSIGMLMREHGLAPQSPPGTPGPFALADAERVATLLGDAGFVEVHVEGVDLLYERDGFDAYWETQLDMSRTFHDAIMGLPEAEARSLREELRERLRPFTDAESGALALPGRALVASASA